MTSVHETAFGRLIDGIHRAFARGDDRYLEKSTEAANVALLRQAYIHLLEDRPEDFAACLANDVTFEIRGLPVWNCQVNGRAETLAAITRNFSTIAEQSPEMLDLVAQGEMVCLMIEERGRLHNAAEPYHLLASQWFTFRDGKIASIREFISQG